MREGKGGRKRGRETSMCSCLLHTPYWEPGLQPRHEPYTGNRITDPLVHRPTLNLLSHTSRGCLLFINWLPSVFLVVQGSEAYLPMPPSRPDSVLSFCPNITAYIRSIVAEPEWRGCAHFYEYTNNLQARQAPFFHPLPFLK